MRRRRFGMRRVKRTVAWIPGLSAMNTATPVQSRALTLAQVNAAVAPNTWGAAILLTSDTDLSLHGGEDAVIERIRGRLMFFGLTQEGAPLGGFARVLIAQQDVTPGGQVMPIDYTTSDGLGRDDILFVKDILVSGTTVVANGTGTATETGTLNDFWFDVDVRAKRKIQSGRQLVLWFQMVDQAAGTPGTVTMAGGLRMLLKRPR